MISSAYTYYLAQYASQSNPRYFTHKKSELRDVYNSMVKINRYSPLYKISDSDNAQEYAIDLKEASSSLIDIASSLHNDNAPLSGFIKKQAESSNEDIAIAKYVGSDSDSESGPIKYRLSVNSLATPQINTSRFLDPYSSELGSGSYSFDLNISNYSYEFQFNVNSEDTNQSIYEKLSRLFNRSNVGIHSELISNNSADVALSLTSASTGVNDNQETLFSIKNNAHSSVNVVSLFGLDNITTLPQNANFTINNTPNFSNTNTFVVDKAFEVTLKDTTKEGQTISIGFKPDLDSIIYNTKELVNGYNSIVDLAEKKSGSSFETSRLKREIIGLSNVYKDYLEPIGLNVDENGRISVDESLIIQSSKEGTLDESLAKLNSFRNSILKKATNISINPMNYVEKKLISYPNPVRSFSKPYVSSIYSGMMFSGQV